MKPACVTDYRTLARRRLPRVLFDYIDGGADGEQTVRRNARDLQAVALRQRVLRDVSRVSTATELFGERCALPVVLAPVGMAGMYARRGEGLAARAAKAAGVPFTLSTLSLCGIEETAAAAGAPPWFQLYMTKDRGFMADMLDRARASGCRVLVFTVDLPVPGSRRREIRNGGLSGGSPSDRLRTVADGLTHPGWFWDVYLRGRPHTLGNVAASLPNSRGMADFWRWVVRNFDPSVTWADLAWVRERWDGPLVIKGVLDVEDARLAVEHGVDGVVVSNHGGRQLDGASSSIAALPEIADAVGGRLTILMDGGVRSGLDVLRALAFGARGVLIGRAWAYALGARGGRGVAEVLTILEAELRTALALTGCPDVRDAGPDLLVRPPAGPRPPPPWP